MCAAQFPLASPAIVNWIGGKSNPSIISTVPEKCRLAVLCMSCTMKEQMQLFISNILSMTQKIVETEDTKDKKSDCLMYVLADGSGSQ